MHTGVPVSCVLSTHFQFSSLPQKIVPLAMFLCPPVVQVHSFVCCILTFNFISFALAFNIQGVQTHASQLHLFKGTCVLRLQLTGDSPIPVLLVDGPLEQWQLGRGCF